MPAPSNHLRLGLGLALVAATGAAGAPPRDPDAIGHTNQVGSTATGASGWNVSNGGVGEDPKRPDGDDRTLQSGSGAGAQVHFWTRAERTPEPDVMLPPAPLFTSGAFDPDLAVFAAEGLVPATLPAPAGSAIPAPAGLAVLLLFGAANRRRR